MIKLIVLAILSTSLFAQNISVKMLDFGNCWVKNEVDIEQTISLVDFPNSKSYQLLSGDVKSLINHFEMTNFSVHCSSSGLKIVLSSNNLCLWLKKEPGKYRVISKGPLSKNDDPVFCHGRVKNEFIATLKDSKVLEKLKENFPTIEIKHISRSFYKLVFDEVQLDEISDFLNQKLEENAYNHQNGEFINFKIID